VRNWLSLSPEPHHRSAIHAPENNFQKIGWTYCPSVTDWLSLGIRQQPKPRYKTMTTFKNKNFTKRNYECTNVVFCIAETAPNENWIATDEAMPSSMIQLRIENGVRYFGWL
jgi:hypothetical protein